MTKIEVRAISDLTRKNKKQNGRRIKNQCDPMFTLTRQEQHGVVINEDTAPKT